MMIKPGEEIHLGVGQRFRVVDVVPFDKEDESSLVGVLQVEAALRPEPPTGTAYLFGYAPCCCAFSARSFSSRLEVWYTAFNNSCANSMPTSTSWRPTCAYSLDSMCAASLPRRRDRLHRQAGPPR